MTSTIELRRCPFCKAKNGIQIHDDEHMRAYECSTCLSVEKITKGKSWWYHGWQQLDDNDEPGLRCDGDGLVRKAPIPFARWADGLETSA